MCAPRNADCSAGPSLCVGGKGQSDKHGAGIPQAHVPVLCIFISEQAQKDSFIFEGTNISSKFLTGTSYTKQREIPSGYCTQEHTSKERHGGAYGGDQRSIFS